MRSRHAMALLSTLLVACGSGGDSVAIAPTVRDSAGTTIIEYAAAAWDGAPTWTLSATPVVTIGADPEDVELDLSTSNLGVMFDDGAMFVAIARPQQVYRFDATGARTGTVGRAGEGPDEYTAMANIARLGGDTVVVQDLFKRVGLLFNSSGEGVGRIQFPLSGTVIPPVLNGRLNDGTWVLQIVNPLQQPEEGAPEIYRIDGPILTWRDGAETYDTLFMVPGSEMTWGSIEFEGGSREQAKAVGYGSNTFVGVQGATVWSTQGDEFAIQGRNADGELVREVRVAREKRPVTEADREHFKDVFREQLDRVKEFLPPGLLQSELKKLEDTPFATHHPQVGFMAVDGAGRLWVTPDFPVLDSVLTWGIFSPEGSLLGKVELPQGMLFAANDSHVVVRREDDETGLVRLEVWGLNPVACEECGFLLE